MEIKKTSDQLRIHLALDCYINSLEEQKETAKDTSFVVYGDLLCEIFEAKRLKSELGG